MFLLWHSLLEKNDEQFAAGAVIGGAANVLANIIVVLLSTIVDILSNNLVYNKLKKEVL